MIRRFCRAAAVAFCASATAAIAAGPTTQHAQPNPQMAAVLEQLGQMGGKPIQSLSAPQARLQPTPADAVLQLLQMKGNPAPAKLPAVAKVEMASITGVDGNPIPVRIYTPTKDQGGAAPLPGIVYLHGGGWVIATIDTYDASARALCAKAGAVVVSVEYRKSPEHKFPAPLNDCYAALQYVMNYPQQFGIDGSRVAVVGESAGGNMATTTCIKAAQENGKMPIHQGMVYPVTNYAFDTESYKENADAKPLNLPMMKWFFEKYLKNPDDGKNPLVSPMRADMATLKQLPPATIVTDQIDPLRSEGIAYGEKLKKAGVDVEQRTYDGVTHEFFGMAAVVDQAKDAQAFMVSRLKAAFNKK